MNKTLIHFTWLTIFLVVGPVISTEPGTPEEPIRYIGQPKIVDQHYHDGQLRPAIGVCSYQAFRANRTHATGEDGSKNRYNHSPMLAYWNDTFYLCHIASEYKEHGVPTQTYLSSSKNGKDWKKPRLIFPAIEYQPGKLTIATQRMSFYVAPNGRLLVTTFLGIPGGKSAGPNTGNGIGRFVREIYKDNSLSPIFILRYMPHAGYTEENTSQWAPAYKKSSDPGFLNACESLLSNTLMTEQWWEDDRSTDGFYRLDDSVPGFECKGMCFYHRKDGKVVGLWKLGHAALSDDEGQSWSRPVKILSKPTAQAKEWGQRTEDGRYALVYNPMPRSDLRWPLAVISGDDGIVYDNMLVVQTEVPPMRFSANYKQPGSNYVRGIAEGNGNPPGNNFWVTYSMNKEDLWVSQIPVPVISKSTRPVHDTFESERDLDAWNLYCPMWAPIQRVTDGGNSYLTLSDEDPHDYAKAVRVFPESEKVHIQFKLKIEEDEDGHFEIEVQDRYGHRPVFLQVVSDFSQIRVLNGTKIEFVQPYPRKKWIPIEIRLDAVGKKFDLLVNGRQYLSNAAFYQKQAETVERIEFRSGHYRRENNVVYLHKIKKEIVMPMADDPMPIKSVYAIDDLKIE